MFSGLQRDLNPIGLCVSAAVLYQLSYEDPYVGSRPICGIHCTRERNETYEYYVNCRHTNEMKMWSSQLWLRFKQSQSKPEKCFLLLDHNPYIVRSRCRRSQSNKKTNKNTNTWERCKSTEPFTKGFYLFLIPICCVSTWMTSNLFYLSQICPRKENLFCQACY